MAVKHGTLGGVRWHTRSGVPKCEPCRRARRRYDKSRRMGVVYSVPAGPVWEHIESLRAQGLGIPQIAKRVGRAEISISRIRSQQTCLASTARLIFSITAPSLEELAPGRCVSATGSRRRLLALQWQRWGPPHLAPLTSVSEDALWRIRGGERRQVQAQTALEIRRLYEQIGTRLGPSRIRRGVPASAWNDIDNPLERPKGVA